jgi:hypothetical protein
MFPVDIPVPNKGVLKRFSPWEIPPDAAARLHNLRVDEGITAQRPGLVAYNTAPDAKQVIDGLTAVLRDGTVRALRCVKDATFYDTGNAWASVTLDAAWTGAARDRFWAAVAPWAGSATGRIIISNGIDIKQWDGDPAHTMAAVAGGIPGRYGLVDAGSRLFVAWTKSGGDHQRIIQWTVPLLPNGGANDWTDPGSGALSIDCDNWQITALWEQNRRVFIGKERSIVVLAPTGNPRNAFEYDIVGGGKKDGDGPLPGSVAQFGDSTAFISQRDVFVFDSQALTPVGGPVVRDLFRRLNQSALRAINAVVDARNGRVGWGLPLDGASTATELWWLDIKTGRWETDGRTHSCVFLHTFSKPVYVDDLTATYPPGKVNDLPGKVNDLSSTGTVDPKIAFGFADGNVRMQSDLAPSDAGSSIAGDYQSASVVGAGRTNSVNGQPVPIVDDDFLVLDKVAVLLADLGYSYALNVSASIDGGTTWTVIGQVRLTTANPTDAKRLVKTFMTTRYPVGRAVQIRLTNITTGVQWGFGTITLSLDVAGKNL